MNSFSFRLIIFLVLDVGALWVGSLYTTEGVQSVWYFSLDKAPWTPPGWVFGTAWTTIMIALSFFMAHVSQTIFPVNFKNPLVALYWLQLLLNIIWNPLFFHYQYVVAGLIVITALLAVVTAMYFAARKRVTLGIRLLVLPYIIWLCIATSLNAYILLMN